MARRGSFSRGVRTTHRWISIAFAVLAATLILPVLPQGAVFDSVSAAAVVLLVAMLLTGMWMAVRHYAMKARRPRRSSAAVTRDPA